MVGSGRTSFGGFPDKIANIMETHNTDEKIRKIDSQIMTTPSAKLYAEKGALLKLASKPLEAIKCYETALTMEPKNVTANEQLGLLLAENQQDTSKLLMAENYLETALSENPNLTQASTTLISIYMKHKKYKNSIPIIENLIVNSPKNYLFHKQLAQAFLACHKYYDAYLAVNKAIDLFGDDLALILFKCDIMAKLEKHAEIVSTVDKAMIQVCKSALTNNSVSTGGSPGISLSTAPKSVTLFSLLLRKADALDQLNKPGPVLEYCDWLLSTESPSAVFTSTPIEETEGDAVSYKIPYRLLTDKSQKADVLVRIAKARTRLSDDPREGLVNFNRALAIDSSCVDAYFNKGLLFNNLKETDLALGMYKKVIELKPDWIEPLIEIAKINYKRSDAQETYHTCKKVLEMDPNNPTVLDIYAQTLTQKRKLLEALSVRKDLCALFPTAENHMQMGLLLGIMSNFSKALAEFDTAIRLDPNFGEAYVHKGTSLNSLGKIQEALECYDKAEKIGCGAFEMAQLWNGRGRIYHGLRDFKVAYECFTKASHYDPEDDVIKKNQEESLAEYDKLVEQTKMAKEHQNATLTKEAFKQTFTEYMSDRRKQDTAASARQKEFVEELTKAARNPDPNPTPKEEEPPFDLPPDIEGVPPEHADQVPPLENIQFHDTQELADREELERAFQDPKFLEAIAKMKDDPELMNNKEFQEFLERSKNISKSAASNTPKLPPISFPTSSFNPVPKKIKGVPKNFSASSKQAASFYAKKSSLAGSNVKASQYVPREDL